MRGDGLPIHLAWYDGKKLRSVCNAQDDGCWVIDREDATCEVCLKKEKKSNGHG